MSLVEFIRQSNSVCTKRRSYSEVFHVKKLSVSHAIEYDSFDFSLDSALEINFSFKGKKTGKYQEDNERPCKNGNLSIGFPRVCFMLY